MLENVGASGSVVTFERHEDFVAQVVKRKLVHQVEMFIVTPLTGSGVRSRGRVVACVGHDGSYGADVALAGSHRGVHVQRLLASVVGSFWRFVFDDVGLLCISFSRTCA